MLITLLLGLRLLSYVPDSSICSGNVAFMSPYDNSGSQKAAGLARAKFCATMTSESSSSYSSSVTIEPNTLKDRVLARKLKRMHHVR